MKNDSAIREDEIISGVLKAINPWNQVVVIGGGFALFVYKLYLASNCPGKLPIATRDFDSLIPRKIPKLCDSTLSGCLINQGFIRVFRDRDIPATECYQKEIEGIEIEVEFLTDNIVRKNKGKNIKVSGVVAQPLKYLELSIENTIPFETFSNQTGKVVSPGAWTLHKGLTFTMRKSPFKQYKDLYGIWYVTSQLDEFSVQAITELKRLGECHPRWFRSFKNNLKDWIENASPADWENLRMQAPSGNLRELHFKKICNELTSS